MIERHLQATKVMLAGAWAVFTVIVLAGALPLAFAAASFVVLLPMIFVFTRWEMREIARQPLIAVDARPRTDERFVFKRFYPRALVASVHLVFGLPVLLVAVKGSNTFRVLALLAVGFIAAGIWRAFHVALVLRSDDVVIRNTWRTHKLRWTNIDYVYLTGDGLAFQEKDRRLGVEAAVTRGKARDRTLVRQVRRYAEPHGVRFDDELRRI